MDSSFSKTKSTILFLPYVLTELEQIEIGWFSEMLELKKLNDNNDPQRKIYFFNEENCLLCGVVCLKQYNQFF